MLRSESSAGGLSSCQNATPQKAKPQPRKMSAITSSADLATVAGAQPLFIQALLIFHALDQLLEILQLRKESFGDEHAHERAVFDHGHIHASPEHLWRCGAR